MGLVCYKQYGWHKEVPLQNGKPHGRGHYQDAQGYIWKGTFVRGALCGYGLLMHPEKQISFEGQFQRGQMSGFGVWKDGLRRQQYRGHWKNNSFHGYGKHENMAEQTVYEGHWRHHQRQGWGKMRYGDGSWYEGEWTKNKRHGKGIFVDDKETKYVCAWQTTACTAKANAATRTALCSAAVGTRASEKGPDSCSTPRAVR